MISLAPDVFYYVYPSWSSFPWKWENLDKIFRDPFGTGFLPNDGKLEKIGYSLGADKFELISGPVQNGIIRSLGVPLRARYFWKSVMLESANFPNLPGFPPSSWEFGVCWLDQKRSDEIALGLEKPFPSFPVSISLDYANCSDSIFFASLSFRTNPSLRNPAGRIDEEVCLRFQMRCKYFGFDCEVASVDGLPDTAKKLRSEYLAQRWFILKRGRDDLGLLSAKMFYLGCAAKQEANRSLYCINLVGAFEKKPAMAKGWRKDGQLLFPAAQDSAGS